MNGVHTVKATKGEDVNMVINIRDNTVAPT